jgi:hypothetical protein
MLKVMGSMQRIELARDDESLGRLRAAADKRGLALDFETRGNFLYGRSIFMGYDLPNGNGDAIPSFFAGDFGPSFVGKNLDYEHLETPENQIGRIMATWHIERPFQIAADGPRIIGRNAFGRDIEGRPQIFRMQASQGADLKATLKELLVEGIWRVDRAVKMGDIVARRLLSGELDSVSQEASTSHALCSVCGHKVVFPFDPVCEHLVKGSMMVRAWQVKGYLEQMLAYKVHQDPVGTGLGVVKVPAFDRAKVAEITAALRSRQMSYEAALAIVLEHERMVGQEADRGLITAALHDFELVAREAAASPPVVTAGEGRSTSYRGYTIEPSGENFMIKDPKGSYMEGARPASVETAKKFIDQEMAEARNAADRRAKAKAAIVSDEDLHEALKKFCQETGRRYPGTEDTPELDALVHDFERHQVRGAKEGRMERELLAATIAPNADVKALMAMTDAELDAFIAEQKKEARRAGESWAARKKVLAAGDMMDDPEHPFVVWNAYEDMPAFPNSFATVEEAEEAMRGKMKGYKHQGFYSTPYGRIPYADLKTGVLTEGMKPDDVDALAMFVVDDRNEGGFVKNGGAGKKPAKGVKAADIKIYTKDGEGGKTNFAAVSGDGRVGFSGKSEEGAREALEANPVFVGGAIHDHFKDWTLSAALTEDDEEHQAALEKVGVVEEDVEGLEQAIFDHAIREAAERGDKPESVEAAAAPAPAAPIFTADNAKQFAADMCGAIKAPYVRWQVSTLGGPENVAILFVASRDPKHKWANDILENSNYARFHLDNKGVLEQFSGHMQHGDLKTKLRKTRVKDAAQAAAKVNALIEAAGGADMSSAPAPDAAPEPEGRVRDDFKDIEARIAATAPAEKDGPAELAARVHSAAVIEARLARETHSLVRHAAVAAALEGAPEARLAPTAARIAALVRLQAALDDSKAKMAARTALVLPMGSSEGAVPSWCVLAALRPLKGAKFGSPLFDSLRVEADRAMPPILGFGARMCAALTAGLRAVAAYGLPIPEQTAAVKSRFDDLSRMVASETQKPGSFGAAKIEAAAAKFVDSLELLAKSEREAPFDLAVLPAADLALGRHTPSFAARRLRLPKDAQAKIQSGLAGGLSAESISIFTRLTEDYLRKPERDAAQALTAKDRMADSARAQAVSDGVRLLARSCQDFKGSLRHEAKELCVAAAATAVGLLKMERVEAAKRVLAAEWNRVFDLDPSAPVRTLAPMVARRAKSTAPAASLAGARIQAAGGGWPWTSQNGFQPESWPQFIEGRSDEELAKVVAEWEGRLQAAVGAEAKSNIESNVRRVRSVLESRRQARGCSARLVGAPRPLDAYWMLRASDGSVLVRVPVLAIVGARRDEVAVKWASSPEYGARLAAMAEKFGAKSVARIAANLRKVSASLALRRLSNGRWMDTNGNSYTSLREAAEQEAANVGGDVDEIMRESVGAHDRSRRDRDLGGEEYPKKLPSGRWQDENGNSYATYREASRAQRANFGAARGGKPDVRMAKNGLPYESYQLSIFRPLGPNEHTHGLGSDSIRHEHGPYEPRHVHENKTGEGEMTPEHVMTRPAHRKGEGVHEQGHVGEGRGRRWVAAAGTATVTSYEEVVTHESAEQGDIDHEKSDGPEDGEVVEFGPEDLDPDDPKLDSLAKVVADFLKREGASEASSSHFYPRVWYTSAPSEDIQTGDSTTTSFHIEGLSDDELREVWNLMKLGPKASLKPMTNLGDQRIKSDMVPWDQLSEKQQKQAAAMFVNQTPVSDMPGHNKPIGNENYHYQVKRDGTIGGRRFLSNKGMHMGRVRNLKDMPAPKLTAASKKELVSTYGDNYPEDKEVQIRMDENPQWVKAIQKQVARDRMAGLDTSEWDASKPEDVEEFISSNAEEPWFKKKVFEEARIQDAVDLSEMDWEDFVDSLDGLMAEFHATNWRAEGSKMGWQGRSGHKEFKAANAKEMLNAILPKTDIHLELYKDEGGMLLKVSHHDAPMGELYSIKPMAEGSDVEGSGAGRRGFLRRLRAGAGRFVLKPAGWKGAPVDMGPQWDLVGPKDPDYRFGLTLDEHEEAGPEESVGIFEERKRGGIAASAGFDVEVPVLDADDSIFELSALGLVVRTSDGPNGGITVSVGNEGQRQELAKWMKAHGWGTKAEQEPYPQVFGPPKQRTPSGPADFPPMSPDVAHIKSAAELEVVEKEVESPSDDVHCAKCGKDLEVGDKYFTRRDDYVTGGYPAYCCREHIDAAIADGSEEMLFEEDKDAGMDASLRARSYEDLDEDRRHYARTKLAMHNEGKEPTEEEIKKFIDENRDQVDSYVMSSLEGARKLAAAKSRGRFESMQLVEGGPWWVVELGPDNKMTPWYGPYDDEETADAKLDSMLFASRAFFELTDETVDVLEGPKPASGFEGSHPDLFKAYMADAANLEHGAEAGDRVYLIRQPNGDESLVNGSEIFFDPE